MAPPSTSIIRPIVIISGSYRFIFPMVQASCLPIFHADIHGIVDPPRTFRGIDFPRRMNASSKWGEKSEIVGRYRFAINLLVDN